MRDDPDNAGYFPITTLHRRDCYPQHEDDMHTPDGKLRALVADSLSDTEMKELAQMIVNALLENTYWMVIDHFMEGKIKDFVHDKYKELFNG